MACLQIELSDKRLREFDRLMTSCDLDTKKELFNNAVTLLNWAVGEVQAGRKVVSLDEEQKGYRELSMPVLEAARKTASVA